MIPREPGCLTWVVHRALGKDPPLPAAKSWSAELAALRASRLTSLAAHLLRPHRETLPHDARAHLEAAELLGESVAEQRRLQLLEAGERFSRLGIEWVALKGWALAARLYPAPACRPSGDLDLLVSSQALPSATAALQEIGYRVEGDDRSYHTRLVRDESGQGAGVIELHHRAGPPDLAGPTTHQVLARRRSFGSAAGEVWIPSQDDELDLLIRHYLRHGGYQAILLLDVLKLLEGEVYGHPLGHLIGNDLARLGLERTIHGPTRWRHAALGRWMQKRTFEQRRSERHAALAGIPMALSRSPLATLTSLARVVWPQRPTSRWVESSKTGIGRHTWRLQRIIRFGR